MNLSFLKFEKYFGNRFEEKLQCNAGGARGNHIRPQEFFPRPSRTHPTPFPFPLNRQAWKYAADVVAFFFSCWTVEGKGKRVEGVRGRREKNLGALWVVSRLPCIALNLSFYSQSGDQDY